MEGIEHGKFPVRDIISVDFLEKRNRRIR